MKREKGANEQLRAELKRLRQRVAELEHAEVERKRAEETLRESEEFSSGLLANCRNPIVGINPDTSISYVNPALEKLIGFCSAELIGTKAPYPWWTEEMFERTSEVLSEAMFKGAESVELLFQKKNGERFWVDISATPIMRDGQFRYYLSNWVDVTERKRAEEALQRSEERFRSIFESIADGVAVTDLELKLIDINRAGVQMLGYSHKEELLGKSGFDIVSDKDRAKAIQDMSVTLASGRSGTLDYNFLGKDGAEIPSEYSVAVMRDSSGAPIGFVAVVKDTTERKRSEQALKESGERYRALFENSIEAVFTVDIDGNFTSGNKALEELTGYAMDELIGVSYKKIVAPENVDFVFREFNKLFRTGEPITNVPYELVARNGERRLCEGYVNVIRQGDWIVGFQGTLRDITERKRVEEALTESEERLKAIFEGAQDAIFAKDREGRYTHVNTFCSSTFGLTVDEMIGKTDFDLFPPEVAHRIKHEADQKVLERGEVVHAVDTKPTAGVLRTFDVVKVPLRDANGVIAGLCGIARDITERKKAEDALRESEEFSSSLLDNAPNPILVINPDTSVRYVNPAFQKLTGFSSREIVGTKAPYPWWTQETVTKTAKNLEEAMRKGAQGLEGLFQKRDGERFWVQVTSIPVITDGESKYYLSNWVDITERKRAEEELRRSEERYRNIFEMVPISIITLDKDGQISDINPHHLTEIAKGQTPEEDIVGKDIVTHPTIVKAGLSETCKRMLEGEPFDRQGVYFSRLTTGADGYFNVRGVPLLENGEVIGAILIHDDVTERKRAEGKLKASLKEKEVLLDEIHHRVKNNLQVISSLLRLQSGYVEDERYAEMFKESQSRVQSMALIHDKLYQSQDLAKVDFGEYIKSLAGALFRSYGSEAGRIALKTQVEGIMLGANYAMPCGLIVNELVSNSLKHAFPKGRKGEIRIAMRPIGENEFELVVSDSGIGIREDLDFRNTESLGLQLVTILAEDQLEGQIELDTTQGTRFQIRFGAAQ